MQFVYPYFLWALAALAIPIIIHLFHFRRFKKVYYSNVHLLKEIKEETSTKSRLKNLLILLSRCATLAALVFAFAQPILTSTADTDNQPRAVEIFVDNSFSMEAEKEEVPLLTIARDKARDIINAHEESDRYLILTHDLEAKNQRYVDQKTAIAFVEEIKISPEVQPLKNIMNVFDRLEQNLSDHTYSRFLLSDFQANISSFDAPIDSTIDITLIPLTAVYENNVGVSNMKWEAPIAMKDQENRLIIELTNYGSDVEEVELRMNYEDQERPLGTVRINPNSVSYDTAAIAVTRTGWHEIELMINDYPIEFDNQLFGSFEIKDFIDVLSIYDRNTNKYLETAFESISYYELRQESKNRIKYEAFETTELIVLDDLVDISSGLTAELIKYVKAGGNLLIFPNVNAQVSGYNSLLAQLNVDRLASLQDKAGEVSTINAEEFVFNDVFQSTRRNIRLPKTKKNWTFSGSGANTREYLLRYRNGTSFMSKYSVERGNVYLCAAPLLSEFNDLVVNAEIWVPMLYKMALSSGIRKPLYYSIGEDGIITSSNIPQSNVGGYLMQGPSEFIPGVSNHGGENYIDLRDQIRSAGQYSLTLNEEKLQTLSFNYNKIESDISYRDVESINQELGGKANVISNVVSADLSNIILERRHGTSLWRWCLIFALLMLLVETTLIRFWK